MLIGCAGVVTFFVICCGLFAVVTTNTKQGPQNEHTWSLNTGEIKTWSFQFNKGDSVTIRVKSVADSDMDLFIFKDKSKLDAMARAKNMDEAAKKLCFAFDNDMDNHCLVESIAPETQTYWVLLANRNSKDEPERNAPNSGKLIVEAHQSENKVSPVWPTSHTPLAQLAPPLRASVNRI